MSAPEALCRFQLTQSCELILSQGDLTAWEGDAIVNAANERMLGGGGVDGAIHRSAGPELREACAQVPEVAPGVRCPTGEARITAASGGLRVRYVIHTVGPVYRDSHSSAGLLAAAHRNSLALAEAEGLETLAFPAISCGVYGYPLDEAAAVALDTCRKHAGSLRAIAFVLYGQPTWDAWLAAAENHLSLDPT